MITLTKIPTPCKQIFYKSNNLKKKSQKLHCLWLINLCVFVTLIMNRLDSLWLGLVDSQSYSIASKQSFHSSSKDQSSLKQNWTVSAQCDWYINFRGHSPVFDLMIMPTLTLTYTLVQRVTLCLFQQESR